MVDIARVNIWGQLAGAIAWNESSKSTVFEYDKNFIKQGYDIAPLQMPLEEAGNGSIFTFPTLQFDTFKGLPGLLSDSLPDRFGSRLMNIWLTALGKTSESINPIERLCYIGKRGMGALEYEPSIMSETSNLVKIEDLVKIAQDIVHTKKGFKADLSDKGVHEIFMVGTSAGGARAKAVIAYHPGTGEVRSGQIEGLEGYEYWIIKFDGVYGNQFGESQAHCNIEYAYYLMALDCGIEMSKCSLLQENERSHFMTKRFDRSGSEKVHMQTLCAIAHYDYNDPLSYSYEQIFQIMRRLRLPYHDAEKMFRRMVLNVIAENRDDHTKNISFLLEKNGKWKLAPAYDLTFAYNPANKWTGAHQLSVNNKRTDIRDDDMLEVATKMNIRKPLEIIEQVRDTVRRWKQFASLAGVKKDTMESIQKVLYQA
jgi:serine/threonine-protein kinase HipA